jgi:hypothetical protein
VTLLIHSLNVFNYVWLAVRQTFSESQFLVSDDRLLCPLILASLLRISYLGVVSHSATFFSILSSRRVSDRALPYRPLSIWQVRAVCAPLNPYEPFNLCLEPWPLVQELGTPISPMVSYRSHGGSSLGNWPKNVSALRGMICQI